MSKATDTPATPGATLAKTRRKARLPGQPAPKHPPVYLPLNPPPAPAAEPRLTELIGLTDDGRMVLWDTQPVLPMSKFPTKTEGGREWIIGHHYVIGWKGHAITVHCSNTMDGLVHVMFMVGQMHLYLPRGEVERMLLGKVHTPEADAEISRLLRKVLAAQEAKQDAPHRQRGRI